jgi:hypothetical protein
MTSAGPGGFEQASVRSGTRLLLSVHFPKSGGKSTEALLREAYQDALLIDNQDDPHYASHRRHIDPVSYMNTPAEVPSTVRAIHGHFHPGKYQSLTDAEWFTVMRHPVPWMVSFYWYWRSAAEGLLNGQRTIWGDLHEYVVDQHLTLEQTARLPIINTMFTETYFGGVDMRRFAFIGDHDDRPAALAKLSEIVGHPMSPVVHENVNPPRPELGETLADTRLLTRLADILQDEIRFYERWALRQGRLAAGRSRLSGAYRRRRRPALPPWNGG